MKAGPKPDQTAFSLVEVVVALGICSFALVAIMGLFTTGLQSGKDSETQIHAANLISLLVSTRGALPTNAIANFAIPERAMTHGYTNAYDNGGRLTNYLASDGSIANSAANALYQISCKAGTNLMTGPKVAQVYIKLTWPPHMNPTNAAAGSYEVLTYIALP